MAIPQEVIDTIKERVSFAEIASEYVELRRSGRQLTGRCPFHSEKTPSFFVREEEGSYHCFGCGKRGSVFNFVMELKGLSFPEAVRFLGGRVGVEVPDEGGSRNANAARSARVKLLREVLRIASEIFAEELERSKPALAYLESRGITSQTIADFRLGYAPQSWSFLEPRVRAHLGDRSDISDQALRESLVEVGLLKERSSQDSPRSSERTHYDVMRDRIIFPIRASDGGVIAFGGRTMVRESTAPKYLNTCESPLYVKRKSLYGLDRALGAARTERSVIIVEGYLDVLSMVQGGFLNTVATCGTALTAQHGGLLRRVADRVIIAFDGDRAGRKAGAQAFETFLNSGLDVAIALFPPELDPDSAIRERGAPFVREVLDHAAPAVEVFLEWHQSEERGEGELTPAILGRVAERFARIVVGVTNPVEREFLLKRGASLLGSSIEALEGLLRQQPVRVPSARADAEDGEPPPAYPPTARRVAPQSSSRSSDEFRSRSEIAQGGDLGADRARDSDGMMGHDIPGDPGADRGGSAWTATDGAGSDPHLVPTAPKPRSVSRAQRTRGGLLRQVVIASLCEPPCAEAFLGIANLLPEAPAPESLAARVRGVLLELSRLEGPGLGELIGAGAVRAGSEAATGSEGPAAEGGLRAGSQRSVPDLQAHLQAVLERFGLGGHGLVESATRQLEVGGWSPGDLLQECQRAVEHLDLRSELEQLRVQQNDQPDESAKLRIAQEKLLKRRQLEKLRQGG